MNLMLPQNIAEIVVRFVYMRKKGNDKEKNNDGKYISLFDLI